MVKVILDEPIEVPDDQVAELCNEIARSLHMGGDFEYEIASSLKKHTGGQSYVIDQILVWSNRDKHGND